MKFAYQSEKFSIARSNLMLPHPEGEAASITYAFHEIYHGLHNLNEQELDDSARGWISTIKDLMDTTGLTDSNGRGLWAIKADLLTIDQKFELSRSVNELANWFDMQFWDRN